MAHKIIIGIDPGQSGGFAVFKDDTLRSLVKMPETERDIFDQLSEYKDIQKWEDKESSIYCWIERVHSFPGQGVASSFKFGKGYGGLRMALIALKIPFYDITPLSWQKIFVPSKTKTESKTQHKNKLKAKAQQLYPDYKITLATCDALLIAEFGRLIKK